MGNHKSWKYLKNTLPTKLYWILFPIEDLRHVVEMAKRILTKVKLDKQLTGQTSTSPFMSIREGTSRKVSFDTRYELGDKIDKLTVMLGRLLQRTTMTRDNLSHKYIKEEEEDKIGTLIKETIRTETG